jgi:hypothetical protein
VNLFRYGCLRTRFSGLLIVFGRTPLILVCLVHAFFDQLQPDVDVLIRGRSVDPMAGTVRTLAPTGEIFVPGWNFRRRILGEA